MSVRSSSILHSLFAINSSHNCKTSLSNFVHLLRVCMRYFERSEIKFDDHLYFVILCVGVWRGEMLSRATAELQWLYGVCSHKNRLIEVILIISIHNIPLQYKKENHPKLSHKQLRLQLWDFLSGIQERVRNSRDKRAFSVRATEVLLYQVQSLCNQLLQQYMCL